MNLWKLLIFSLFVLLANSADAQIKILGVYNGTPINGGALADTTFTKNYVLNAILENKQFINSGTYDPITEKLLLSLSDDGVPPFEIDMSALETDNIYTADGTLTGNRQISVGDDELTLYNTEASVVGSVENTLILDSRITEDGSFFSTAHNQLLFKGRWLGSTPFDMAAIAGSHNSSWGGGLIFKYKPTGSSSGPLSTGMVLNHLGNVGIGTTAPAENLAIVKSGGATLSLGTGENVANTTNEILFRFRYGPIAGGQIGAYIKSDRVGGVGDYNLRFGTISSLTLNATDRMVIDPTGNVILSGQINGGFGAETTAGVTDWNDVTNARSGSGRTLLRNGSLSTNGPPTGSYFHPFSFEYASKNGGGNMTQFAIPYAAADMDRTVGVYFRTRFGGVWEDWARLIHEDQTGDIRFRSFGVGLKENTATYLLGVQASGDVVEVDPVDYENVWDKNGSNAFYNSGNVGVGTNTPTYQVHVKKDGLAGFMTESISATSYAAQIVRNNSGATVWNLTRGNAATGSLFGVNNANNSFLYSTGNQLTIGTFNAFDLTLGTNSQARITVDGSSGNVGIGTTTPNTLLDVESTTNAQIEIDRRGAWTATHAGLRLPTGTNGSVAWTVGMNPVGNNNFFIDYNNANRFFINTVGNVGIGTTTPSAKLHVDGGVRFENLSTGGADDGILTVTSDGIVQKDPLPYLEQVASTTYTKTYGIIGDSGGSAEVIGLTNTAIADKWSNADISFVVRPGDDYMEWLEAEIFGRTCNGFRYKNLDNTSGDLTVTSITTGGTETTRATITGAAANVNTASSFTAFTTNAGFAIKVEATDAIYSITLTCDW